MQIGGSRTETQSLIPSVILPGWASMTAWLAEPLGEGGRLPNIMLLFLTGVTSFFIES
jgi:hypothetical protein